MGKSVQSPGAVRRERTRSSILREAMVLMEESGIEGVGIRELARRLDYSPAALYRYFPRHEDIVSTLAADSMALLYEHLANATDKTDQDPLVALGEAYLRFAESEPVRFRLLFVHLPSHRTSIEEPASQRSPYAIVLGAVRDALADGRIAHDLDPENVAYTLWSLVHGMGVLRSTHLRDFEADFDALHRSSLQLLIDSWKPRERDPR
jgi:AcrR family transcriptional regulator